MCVLGKFKTLLNLSGVLYIQMNIYQPANWRANAVHPKPNGKQPLVKKGSNHENR